MLSTGNRSMQAKLVLLGDVGSGKTSLVSRFVKGQFFDFQESTIGAAFFTQVLSLNEATIKFDIWDTAGQERYHSLAPIYYRGAAAAVVLYDITSTDSFQRAKKWVLQLQRQGNRLNYFLDMNESYETVKVRSTNNQPDCIRKIYLAQDPSNEDVHNVSVVLNSIVSGNPNLITFLVGNKADLGDKRKVGNEEGEQYAEENGLHFLETSAKTAQNVNELFYEIAKRLVNAAPSRHAGMNLHSGQQESAGRSYCCS